MQQQRVEVVGQRLCTVLDERQHLEAPRSWMGTEGVNIFQLLLQLINVVEQLANQHTLIIE